MTEAEQIVATLERCRNETMQRGIALDADRARIAFEVMVGGSTVARNKWRELDDAQQRLVEDIELLDHAIIEARRLASVRDWTEQWAELTGAKK